MSGVTTLPSPNSENALAPLPAIPVQSAGVGELSTIVNHWLRTVTPAYTGDRTTAPKSIEERLFDTRAQFKIFLSQIAMHLTDEWRTALFSQLDNLLDPAQWENADRPPRLGSFQTFVRMLLLLRSEIRPGIGATHDGNIIAAWTRNENRLTIECLDRDAVRWSLMTTVDSEKVRAAGLDTVRRLPTVLAPYAPQTWLKRA